MKYLILVFCVSFNFMNCKKEIKDSPKVPDEIAADSLNLPNPIVGTPVVTNSINDDGYYYVKTKTNPNTTNWVTYLAKTIDKLPAFDLKYDPALNSNGSWKIDKKISTGFYRVEKIGERWWIIDPEGYPFIHKGIAVLQPGSSVRQKAAFSDKFGTNQNWSNQTTELLRNNGFNGAGNWSDTETIKACNHPLAYTVMTYPMQKFRNWHKANVAGGDYGKTDFQGYQYDIVRVFDPKFDEFVEKEIKGISQYSNDKNCLGYYTDNELPWDNDALDRHLKYLDKRDVCYVAAKKWFVDRKGKNANLQDITQDDRMAFNGFYFETYIAKVSAAVKKYAPNQLYLGCRFNQEKEELLCQPIFEVAGKYIDVISINHYRKWEPDQDVMAKWASWSGKPFMITEFYTKGMDSGLPNTTGAGWTVPTQTDRGLFYQNFCIELVKSKVCVGWHWFNYQDNDPANGGADVSNLNANKGIVNSDYIPYDDLLDHMKFFNCHVYELIHYFDKE
ncbi:MAG: hypothetical protein ACERKD_17310 [Prolixibacteraceae bacterium]